MDFSKGCEIMNTEQRLNQAFAHARVETFNENSKYVFFSDCHRGDDSISDEFARNQALTLGALSYYYKNGFTYVEAGDGDELWEHNNFKYIRTAHSDIFTMLKEFYVRDRLIMLYGNHNLALKNKWFVQHNYFYYYDEYKEQFEKLFYNLKPIEALRLVEEKTGQNIFVVHGHQGDFFNDQFWIVSMIAVRFFWRFMHLGGFRNPASPAKNQFTSRKIERKYQKWLKYNDVILICGHTHRIRFPKKADVPYFNIGCCVHTKGITAIELENNKISLVQWRVQADEEGNLQVMRRAVYGPEKIYKWKKKRNYSSSH